jgi:hypothetical protein
VGGTSTSASYGPPYNSAGSGQQIFFLHLQSWLSVHQQVDPPEDFVLRPLSTVTGNPSLAAAPSQYRGASSSQQQAWASAYDKAIAAAPDGDPTRVTVGGYGPVPVLTTSLLGLARSGALDTQLVNHGSGFYQDNYTEPLLFISDGGYLDSLAGASTSTGTSGG